MDVSRLEADRVILSLESCNVVQICQQVVASVAQSRRSTNQFLFECEREVDVYKRQVLGYKVSGNEFSNENLLILHFPEENLINGGTFGFEGSIPVSYTHLGVE